MLRDAGIANPKQFGKFADGALARDELAEDEQAVPVGHRLKEFASAICRTLHCADLYIHDCEYTNLYIHVKSNRVHGYSAGGAHARLRLGLTERGDMSGSRHIVCSHCGQINSVATDRPAQQARCGACREAMFTGHPARVDEIGFERHAAHSDIPLLVDVWAPWCGPCRAMAPMFERAAAALEPDVRLLKLNSDEAPQLSTRLGIRSIPTLLLVRGGRVLARTSGVMRTEQIVAWARTNLEGTVSA